MISRNEPREPTPREWATAREVHAELKKLEVGLTDEQLHVVRQTVIATLIRMSETSVTACKPRG